MASSSKPKASIEDDKIYDTYEDDESDAEEGDVDTVEDAQGNTYETIETTKSNDKDWSCRRCHHPSTTKGNLLTHLKRKHPCTDTFDKISITDYVKELTFKETKGKMYKCPNCDKQYTTRQSRHRHKLECKATKSNGTSNEDPQVKIANLEKENKKLQSRIESLEIIMGNSNVHNTVTTNHYNINNQIQININSFGSENTSYLTPEFLSYCLLNPRKGMTSLIENIHYNKEYPENQNIRCKSLKQNIFEKYVDAEWRACDASNTLDELIKKGYRILNAHYTDNYMNDPQIQEDEIKQMAYERFRFLTDTQCNDYFAVKREVRLLVKDRTMYLLESPDTPGVPSTSSEPDGIIQDDV